MSAAVIPTGTPDGHGVEGSLALYFIHNDHLGTPRKITDGEQRIVWSMEQTPFGEVALTTEASRMPMRFPGQYADIESGFSYNYFRDYDPSLGRYIQSDPIGLDGGINTYGYAEQNPIMYTDPTGETAVPAPWIWVVPVPGARFVGGVILIGAGAYAIYDMCTKSDEEREKRCEENLDRDMEMCDTIANAERAGKRPVGAAARCRSSAMQRYGNCLAGRDPGPLDTWNN